MDATVVVNQGRALEVREYGDRRGHPAFFFHGLIGSHYQASYVAERKLARLSPLAGATSGGCAARIVAGRSHLLPTFGSFRSKSAIRSGCSAGARCAALAICT